MCRVARGDGMTLDPKLIVALDDLSLVARTVVEGFLSGLHRSPFLGYSSEFGSYRPYMQGDNLRHVDWKVWGRTDTLYVKQFEDDTNLHGQLLLDTSASMDFGNPVKFRYARTLAAALAIPILIHLLLRRKKQRLRFSTIRFFARQDERSSRRRKLRNLLLLATRLLLLTLVVLAFARPYLPTADTADVASARRQMVLILDRSASMQAGDRWAQSLAAARVALAELDGDDRAALVEASGRASVLSPPAPPARIRSLLDELEPGFGVGDLGEALREAVKLLPVDTSIRATLHIISDLQERACETLASAPVPQGVETRVALIGESNTSNLAVSGLELESSGSARIQLRSFSDQDAEGISVEVRADGGAVAAQFVDVPARATAELSLPLPALKSGWHTLSARIQSGDRFDLDDVRHIVVRVPEVVSVLCVEADPAATAYEAETYFVMSAFNPVTGATNEAWRSPFQPERIAPAALARRLAQSPSPSLVFLTALRQFPPELGRVLERFVEQGGGLALFVGESFSPNRYLAELGAVLPAIPGAAQGALNRPEDHWRMASVDRQTPLFAAFRRPDSGDLSLPVFKRRHTLEPIQGAQVPARFIDGAPFVVTREFGKGRVVLVNTTPDTGWTDWPKRRTFVPWIHSLAHWLDGRGESEVGHEQAPHVAGGEVEVGLGADAAAATFLIDGPGVASLAVQADEHGLFMLNLERPGVHSVRPARDRQRTNDGHDV
jgi:uncharacterized protein (DUF58 family)